MKTILILAILFSLASCGKKDNTNEVQDIIPSALTGQAWTHVDISQVETRITFTSFSANIEINYGSSKDVKDLSVIQSGDNSLLFSDGNYLYQWSYSGVTANAITICYNGCKNYTR